MLINVKSAKKAVLSVLDDDGFSVEELAQSCNVSMRTLYNIMDESVAGVQRAIIRKIAAGTGRTFKIDGDKVTFYREEKRNEKTNDPITEKILQLLDRQTEKRKQLILSIIEDACQLSGEHIEAKNEKG